MKDFLHKQPYSLTVARHNLGIHQMRIMASAVKALQPLMSMEVDYTKPSNDVWLEVEVGNLVKSNNVKPLRDALDGLMKKIVRIMHFVPERATHLEIGTPIVQQYKYEHGRSVVRIKISGDLVPQIIDLARGYTRYSLAVAFNTSSPNTFKLYQYIAHFRRKKQINCKIDFLRKWLKLEEKYQMPSRIKERILIPAMNELKAKADVWFTIDERITKGRKMIGWKFNIHTKKEVKQLTSAIPQPIPSKDENLYKRLVEVFKLSERQAAKVVGVDDKETMRKELYQISLLVSDKKIRNIGGYTAKVLGEKLDIKL